MTLSAKHLPVQSPTNDLELEAAQAQLEQARRAHAKEDADKATDFEKAAKRAAREARRKPSKAQDLEPFEPRLDMPSIILPRFVVEELTTRRNRKKGPDHDIMVFRWVLFVAILQATTGFEWVYASPAKVEREFKGREIGKAHDDGVMERSGMTSDTLGKLRERALRYLRVSDGKYSLRRVSDGARKSGNYYPYDFAFVVRACFELSNQGLRAAFAGSAPAFAAQSGGRVDVVAPARACAVRSGQGATVVCRAFRELRRAQVLEDNYPGRSELTAHVDANGVKQFRYDIRKIIIPASPMVPLAPHAVRWAVQAPIGHPCGSEATRHRQCDTEDLSSLSAVPTQADSVGAAVEVQPTPPASPSPSPDRIETVPPTKGSEASPSAAAPSAPLSSVGQASAPEDWQKITPVRARQVLAETGHFTPAMLSGARSSDLRAIAHECRTVLVLRRVLRTADEAIGDDKVRSKVAWLAMVVQGEGYSRLRDPSWSGPWRTSPEGAAAPPVERRERRQDSAATRACRRAVQQAVATDDPRVLEIATGALRATAAREGRPELAEGADTLATSRSRAPRATGSGFSVPHEEDSRNRNTPDRPTSSHDLGALRAQGWHDDGREREGIGARVARGQWTRFQ